MVQLEIKETPNRPGIQIGKAVNGKMFYRTYWQKFGYDEWYEVSTVAEGIQSAPEDFQRELIGQISGAAERNALAREFLVKRVEDRLRQDGRLI